MSEFEDIQRLIRLKRHERPSADFVEDFVTTFQQRQRSEMLRNSARGLLWERVTTYMEGLLNPKWAWAGATATAVIGLGFMLRPAAPVGAGQVAQNHPAAITIDAKEVQAASYQVREATDLQRNSLSGHFGGGLGDEQLVSGTTGQMYPAGFYLDLMESGHQR